MKISDLQYIETINDSELQGGTTPNINLPNININVPNIDIGVPDNNISSPSNAFAGGGAGALTTGNDSSAVTSTVLVADPVNGFAFSGTGGSGTGSI